MLKLKANFFNRYVGYKDSDDSRSLSTIEVANINTYHNVTRESNDNDTDRLSLTHSSNISNAILIEKYKKRNFFDYFNNKWRVLFSSVIVIATVIIWAPLSIKSYEDLSLKGSILHDAVVDDRLLKLTYALVAIIIPNALDTVLDLIQFRTLGISWDIHERLLFIFLTAVPPWILIFYSRHQIFPFVYMALNQSSSVVIMCSINSMISKLEKHHFRYSMYFCTIPCLLMASAACLKIWGLWDDRLTNVGMTLAPLAYILQFVNFVYWTVDIVYTNLKKRSGPGEFKMKQCLNIDNIETTVILYFVVLICWMVGIFISNYITNSLTWRDTSSQNLISYAYLQIVLSLLIIGLPMRWFRNEQIVVYETLAELNRNASINENPLLLPNDAVHIAESNVARNKRMGAPSHEQVTVLHIDLTSLSNSLENDFPIEKALLLLDTLFTIFDYCTSLYMHEGLEKIESVSYSYLVICGDSKHPEHASIISNFAAIIKQAVSCVLHPITKKPVDIRIGVHTGSIILGKVGFLSTRLGLFGTTIDKAMETAMECNDGKILCTQEVVTAIAESTFDHMGDMFRLNVKPREIEGSTSKKFYCIDGLTRPHSSPTFVSDLMDKCNLIIKTKLITDMEFEENDNAKDINEGDEESQ